MPEKHRLEKRVNVPNVQKRFNKNSTLHTKLSPGNNIFYIIAISQNNMMPSL